MATEAPVDRPRSKPRIAALVLVLGVAAGLLVLDQLTKAWVVAGLPLGERVEVLGEALQFIFVRNPGAAFSLGGGLTWIFAILAAAVAVIIIVFARRIRSLAWASVFGLLLGGTLGNLADRLFREPGFGTGHVVDFIKIWGFPAIFNVADIAITASMVTLVLLTLLGIGLDGSRSRARTASRPEPPAVDRGEP